LSRIDPAIISSYYTQALNAIPSITSVINKNDHAARILELVEIKSREDGELYAQEVINLLVQLENIPLAGDSPVVEPVVEGVLLCLRNGVFAN
jgi:hypothetical protein